VDKKKGTIFAARFQKIFLCIRAYKVRYNRDLGKGANVHWHNGAFKNNRKKG